MMQNPFYIDTRYPVHWPTHYDKETALRAKGSAEEIRRWVRTLLGFSGRTKLKD